MKKWIATLTIYTSILYSIAAVAAQNFSVKPDNTAINKRDLNKAELTAEDQSNRKADVEITRKIRRELTNDSTLSLYAKNVKIIVRNDDVTLKGPVRNQVEKAKILKIATMIAPEHRVHNQLVVTR